MSAIGNVEYVAFEEGKPVSRKIESVFHGKKVVVFALPGAFTPTCSSSHLPRYEELYDTFRANGVDEIYCVSVNDEFVMRAWWQDRQIENVKFLADGNGSICEALGILIDKSHLGFGKRALRSSFYIVNGKVEKSFKESNEDPSKDPLEVSDADTMLNYIAPKAEKPHRIAILGVETCSYCRKAKEYLDGKKIRYAFVELAPRDKLIVVGAVSQTKPTTPQVFLDGKYIGGYDELVKAI